MFSNVSDGSAGSDVRCRSSDVITGTCARRRAGSARRWLPAAEIAIDGTPSASPSIAAATVPEYSTSSPMFWPWFTPLSTKSGRSGINASSESMTQSVGVPSTCQRRSPRFTGRSGWCSVREWLVALCSRSGATTVTSPSGSAAVTRHSIPCAKMPSSFVTSRRIDSVGQICAQHRDELLELRLERLERLHRERAARHHLQIAALSVLVDLLSRTLDGVLLIVQEMLHQHDQLDLAALVDAIARAVLRGTEEAKLTLPVPE